MVQIRTSNKVLAAVEPVTFQRLLPHLEPVGLRRKQVLYEPDAEIRHIYFPESCVIVLVTMMQSGETIESMTVGREGVTWVPALSGAATMPCQTMVAIDGEALRIEVELLKREASQSDHLRDLLGRYSNTLLLQAVRSTACNGVHTLDQRCARWILTTLDRVEPSERFSITHDFLAYLLGASRQTVTTLMNEFTKKGYLESDRGVRVLQRHQGTVCEDVDHPVTRGVCAANRVSDRSRPYGRQGRRTTPVDGSRSRSW